MNPIAYYSLSLQKLATHETILKVVNRSYPSSLEINQLN